MNPDTNRFEKLESVFHDADRPENRHERRAREASQRRARKPATTFSPVEHPVEPKLVRPDGSPVPEHWSVFAVGEEVIVKGYRFRVGHLSESTMLLEPAGPVIIETGEEITP